MPTSLSLIPVGAGTDPNKSCRTCPSYLTGPQSVSKFKKSVNAPVCGRYGHVLARPNAEEPQRVALAKHFASGCDSYGLDLPVVPLDASFKVALPIPEARDTSNRTVEQRDDCTSCVSCVNYIRSDKVYETFGWSAGMCAAKGKLLLENRLGAEAKHCEFRRSMTSFPYKADDMMLLPEYADAFSLTVDPTKAYFKNKGHEVDPRDWPTDKPVEPVDTAAGVRAWRRIDDPEGTGNFVHLPIYEASIFTPLELSKIPQTGDDEHPELYIDHQGLIYAIAVAWTELDETPAAWGEAGVGKTEIARHLAWLMQLPFERISITGSTEIDDLAGKMNYSPEEGTVFHYGRLPKAWTRPSVLIIDEPNVGPPEVWQFLRPLTDNSKQLVLDMNAGEHLKRHDDCYLMMAMNPAWDPKNVGAEQIGDADARRLFHMHFELPPPELEAEIVRNRVRLDGWEIDDKRIEIIGKIAVDIRALCNDNTLPITWGVAQQIKVARASRWFDLITAYRRAIADYMEPTAQAALLDQVRSHV